MQMSCAKSLGIVSRVRFSFKIEAQVLFVTSLKKVCSQYFLVNWSLSWNLIDTKFS